MHYWPDNGSAGNAEACPGVKMDRTALELNLMWCQGALNHFYAADFTHKYGHDRGVKDSRIPYLYR